jgi:hypothetical protein
MHGTPRSRKLTGGDPVANFTSRERERAHPPMTRGTRKQSGVGRPVRRIGPEMSSVESDATASSARSCPSALIHLCGRRHARRIDLLHLFGVGEDVGELFS